MLRKQFAARVWSKLVAFEREQGLFKKGDRVLAAVSGGPDSVCLAHYLASSRRRLGIELALAHVNHGLRGRAAEKDARFVAELAEKLKTPLVSQRVPTKLQAEKRGKGIEDAARELRYASLAQAARKMRCRKVATAHHLDDQAETVLLHLLRGTRLAALGGMAPRRALAPGRELIRPLLCLTRADVLAYLEVHGLPYRRDRSNDDPKFTRNWIRSKVLPLLASKNPRVRERLAGIAAQVRRITAGR